MSAIEKATTHYRGFSLFDPVPYRTASFEGIISGVISSGLFVELLEFPVEGFISVSSFRDDYYVFEKEKHRLLGKDTKKSFMLGDKLEIRVKNVKIAERQVDFSPVKYQSV
ncbi:MAG: S1 RNA-binding domain-containing protein [Planctomycetes bacterium]|nr:S1 RNA-binding domain-containing protein [Planctomycetota bacterium]